MSNPPLTFYPSTHFLVHQLTSYPTFSHFLPHLLSLLNPPSLTPETINSLHFVTHPLTHPLTPPPPAATTPSTDDISRGGGSFPPSFSHMPSTPLSHSSPHTHATGGSSSSSSSGSGGSGFSTSQEVMMLDSVGAAKDALGVILSSARRVTHRTLPDHIWICVQDSQPSSIPSSSSSSSSSSSLLSRQQQQLNPAAILTTALEQASSTTHPLNIPSIEHTL